MLYCVGWGFVGVVEAKSSGCVEEAKTKARDEAKVGSGSQRQEQLCV